MRLGATWGFLPSASRQNELFPAGALAIILPLTLCPLEAAAPGKFCGRRVRRREIVFHPPTERATVNLPSWLESVGRLGRRGPWSQHCDSL